MLDEYIQIQADTDGSIFKYQNHRVFCLCLLADLSICQRLYRGNEISFCQLYRESAPYYICGSQTFILMGIQGAMISGSMKISKSVMEDLVP